MEKILTAMPTNRLVKPKCAESVLKMIKASKHKVDGLVSVKGYNTAGNRNHIAVQAIKGGYTHLFLIDDDMVYEPDTIDKLIDSDKDIIGGLYKTKYEKQDWVIEMLSDSSIYNFRHEGGLFPVKAIGGGLLMIRTEALKKIPQPHFGYLWHSNGMVKESNDWYFCRKARENGFKIWCDPKIIAKHIGLKEY